MTEEPTPDEAEFYATPHWPVDRALERLVRPVGPLPCGGSWFDPCVGEGAIVEACNEFLKSGSPHWTTMDIRNTHWLKTHGGMHQDYLSWQPTQHFDVAIFNPPFTKALAMLRKLVTHCDRVVMLQRLNWKQGPVDRHEWLKENAFTEYVIPQRVPFVAGKGSDPGGHSWHLFPPAMGVIGTQMLGWTSEDVIKAARRPAGSPPQLGLNL